MKYSMKTFVRKGNTVWYWHDKLKDWKKGKIVAVNRYSLIVRRRDDKRLQGLPHRGYPVVPSNEPKPDVSPQQMQERLWNNYSPSEKYRLLVKLGLKK